MACSEGMISGHDGHQNNGHRLNQRPQTTHRRTVVPQHSGLLISLPVLLAIPSQPLLSFSPKFTQDVAVEGVDIVNHRYATAALPSSSTLGISTPGSIRVSNSTYHPIRIALLPQVPASSEIANSLQPVALSQQTDHESHNIHTNAVSVDSPQSPPQYGEPIHWDFVPREGHGNGLVLAIAEGHVKVQPGDVLTAFAQDGSRRYWGPYVVGVTESPVWNSETQEWSLVLETGFPW